MDKRVDEVGSRQALVAALTARERQVLALRARGHSIAEIAAALVIEQRTVKFHLTNIYAKLSIDQRSYGARQLALACFAEVLDPAAPASAAQVLGPPLRQEARNVAALTDIPPSAGGAGQPVPWEPVLTAAFTRPHGYKIDDYLTGLTRSLLATGVCSYLGLRNSCA